MSTNIQEPNWNTLRQIKIDTMRLHDIFRAAVDHDNLLASNDSWLNQQAGDMFRCVGVFDSGTGCVLLEHIDTGLTIECPDVCFSMEMPHSPDTIDYEYLGAGPSQRGNLKTPSCVCNITSLMNFGCRGECEA